MKKGRVISEQEAIILHNMLDKAIERTNGGDDTCFKFDGICMDASLDLYKDNYTSCFLNGEMRHYARNELQFAEEDYGIFKARLEELNDA